MTIETEPKRFRAATARSDKDVQVDRKGGQFGVGLISGVSMITRGEALGHGVWCDAEFLSQVSNRTNSSNTGIKARFTHPGLSSDGVGTKLGKFFNARVEGDKVIADLHIQEAAYKTPDGDLADYVMTLAEETPEDFGLSIVFEHDIDSTNEYSKEHTNDGEFESPDEDNEYSYPHARLSELYACDAVDSPAANPDGLFKRGQEAAVDADSLVEYALGLSDVKPSQSLFGVDGDRAKQFVTRLLSRHGLSLGKEEDMENEGASPAQVDGLTRADFNAELGRYVEAFGKENGTEWFIEELSFSECQTKQIEVLRAELSAATVEIASLNEKIDSLSLGEEDSGEFSSDEESDEDGPAKFAGLAGKIKLPA